MTAAGWLLLAIVALLVVGVFAEGRRQRRRYGRGTGTALARAGLLELQRQLEPERKVELLIEERREPERDAQGEGPPADETGRGAPRSTE